MAKTAYPIEGGSRRRAFEWCLGTIFAELSGVDDPADKSAEVQEGLLQIADRDPISSNRLTASEIHEISSFVAQHPQEIPESLAKLINSVMPQL